MYRTLCNQSRALPRPVSFRIHRCFFQQRPGPPPLPKEDQDMQRAQIERANRPLSTTPTDTQSSPQVQQGDELHPDARRPLAPEFAGEVNPKTGEQGGPKREPLRHGDWSYGGRATDF